MGNAIDSLKSETRALLASLGVSDAALTGGALAARSAINASASSTLTDCGSLPLGSFALTFSLLS